uniref:ABC transporter permease n=1 Tax=Acetatifactor sp. TaxID=1872090 RepID=UPI004057B882
MKKYFRIYKETIKNCIAQTATYRANFILGTVVTILSNIVFPLITLLIYQSGASFEGWTMYEVLLIQSIFSISNGISGMMFSGIVWNTMHHVADGTLEIILIKPVNCLFYLLATSFSISDFGMVLGGVVILGISIVHIGSVTLANVLLCLVLFLFGLSVMLGVILLMAATSFKWVSNSRIPEMYESVANLGNYPQNIFPKWIIGLTSFVMPVAMVGFFPASALLNRMEPWMFFTVLPCILFLAIGIGIYQYMVRLYEGVGG